MCGLFAACFALGWSCHLLALRLRPAWRRLEAWHAALVRRLPAPAHPLLRLPVWLLRRTLAELILLAAAGALLLGTGALFIEVLEAVLEPERLALLDRAVFAHLQALRQPWLDTAMVMATELGGAWVTVPLMATVAVALLATGRRAAAAYWLGAHIASRLSVAVLFHDDHIALQGFQRDMAGGETTIETDRQQHLLPLGQRDQLLGLA